MIYKNWSEENGLKIFCEPQNSRSNYWLNSVVLDSKKQRDEFLSFTNEKQVMTRAIWKPMHTLPMYKKYEKHNLENTNWFADRLVNIPSSVIV